MNDLASLSVSLDIDECSLESNPCVRHCENLPGSFKCYCPPGRTGDGTKNGTGCRRFNPLDIGLGNNIIIRLCNVSF